MRPELKCLVKARTLIADPAKWGHGKRGKDRGWNTFEAAEAIEEWPNLTERRKAFAALGKAAGLDNKWGELVEWNDRSTHAEVLAAFDKAIASVS